MARRVHNRGGRGAAPRPPPRPTRQSSEEPFDSEAHFRDYDHDAVHELSAKTVICPATFNRKGTVEACLEATNLAKLGAKMYIHDDGSKEYDEEWLGQFGDRVFRHPHGVGGRTGVKNLRSNMVKSLLGDFEPKVFQPWLEEDFGPEGPTYLYMVDSDGYHDPHFLYRIHEIMALGKNWGSICLYNAKFHQPRHGRADKNVIDRDTVLRSVGAGISQFFRLQSFRDKPDKVQVPDRRGWDGFYCREIAGRKVVTSVISYVEHFGKWGFHNKGNFDRCRALCPTEHLVGIRDATIKRIEKTRQETPTVEPEEPRRPKERLRSRPKRPKERPKRPEKPVAAPPAPRRAKRVSVKEAEPPETTSQRIRRRARKRAQRARELASKLRR